MRRSAAGLDGGAWEQGAGRHAGRAAGRRRRGAVTDFAGAALAALEPVGAGESRLAVDARRARDSANSGGARGALLTGRSQ